MEQPFFEAPELDVAQWFNTEAPPTLAGLRGKVVVLHAFQMLCPGCVRAGLPQAQKIAAIFPADQVAVIGLHTVFEHHAAMTPVALSAFIHEYRLTFPIAVDRPSEDGPIPRTMAAYGMRGTPSLVLIDRMGLVRRHAFGAEEDLKVGAEIALLMAEAG
ncbi:redoxin domain-containing protein [Shinella pollutisoli]|uniref:Redoxin domain-containing protein n=1 Tax=Shinella pollutisoli TaxID=2250594 RepID=A0ABV7DLV8_9HYPH|nr:redoxin domain-containing protein [Shinella pollutisoli]